MSKTSLEIAIRRQLGRFVAGKANVREFAAWFAPRLRGAHGSPTLEDLVYEIELRLAEFSNGDWSEDELRTLLRSLVNTYRVSFVAAIGSAPTTQLGTSTSTTVIQPSMSGFGVAALAL